MNCKQSLYELKIYFHELRLTARELQSFALHYRNISTMTTKLSIHERVTFISWRKPFHACSAFYDRKVNSIHAPKVHFIQILKVLSLAVFTDAISTLFIK